MEKKEEKLKDINDLLKREIEPQMEKLRKVFIFIFFPFNFFSKKNIGKRNLFIVEIRRNGA